MEQSDISDDPDWIWDRIHEMQMSLQQKAIEFKGTEGRVDCLKKILDLNVEFPGFDLGSQHRIMLELLGSERSIRECLHCMAFCRLFPRGYEIEGDELVQLWIGAGLIELEPIEVSAASYLTIIQDMRHGFISLTRQDSRTGEKWYKLNHPVQASSTFNAVNSSDSHAFFWDQPLNFDSVVRSAPLLKTLLLLKGHSSSHIHRLPHGFFTSLELLKALDLSATKLSELPTSIGFARFLCYLNLSHTLIRRLPETICCLPNLQTLKLRNCDRLVALPKALSRVTSLRHLDLGIQCDLCSMPPQMGALTRLYTLSNFITGKESGCRIGELKNLNNLTGRVCLSKLENIGSVDEVKEARLQYKRNITQLELRWTDGLEWENVESGDCEVVVIEHLQPPKELQTLEIICYQGSKLPSWISMRLFDKLTSITLFKCENCQLLPSLGQIPALESLTLIEFVQVKIIDLTFCVDTIMPYENNFVAFPKLQRLEMESMLSLEEWRNMGEVDYFPCLTKLVIKDCPQLTTIFKLSNVCSLEYLELNCCGELSSLPEGGLPILVKTFVIDDCPLLSSTCNTSLEEEQGWHKTEHTSTLLIFHRD